MAASASHYIVDGMTTIWHLWRGKLSDSAHQRCETQLGDSIGDLLAGTKPAQLEAVSQGNTFREIARRTEAFFLKWWPSAVAVAQSGANIAQDTKAVEMIQDVKDNLTTMWSITAKAMTADAKKAKIAANYGLQPLGPVPASALESMRKSERSLFQ